LQRPISVLAGPPKCGTSSLFRWLADHPAVTPARVKETFYLVDEDSPLRRPGASFHDGASHERGVAGYRGCFPTPGAGCRLLLEATTHYLYQRTAREVLAALGPPGHAVFVLRKPSERIYSSYRYTQHHLGAFDPEVSFARFQRLLREGRVEELRHHARSPRSFWVLTRDVAYSRYLEHLRPWRRSFGDDRFHVLVFERLRADPRGEVTRLAARLGLDPGFYDDYDFAPFNETFEPRSRLLHRWLRRLAGWLPKNRLTRAGHRGYLALQRRRGGSGERSAEDRAALEELDEHFRPHNAELAAELGLDLTPWGEPWRERP